MGAIQTRTDKGRPRVSVLIPAYNSGLDLRRAIGSVLAQDWPDVELIVSDDGSAAFDCRQVMGWIREGDRGNCTGRVFANPRNLGTVANLNLALAKATGQWVMLLAADDALVESGTISRLMEACEEQEAEWMISRTMLCDGELRTAGRLIPTDREMDLVRSGEAREIWKALGEVCFLPSSGTVFSMAFLTGMGGFDSSFRLVEDWPLFLKAVRQGRLPGVCGVTSVLHRSGGVSERRTAGKNEQYQRDLVTVMQRMILPELEWLPARERESLRTLCGDKLCVYRLRFGFSDMPCKEKAVFVIKNGCFIPLLARKLFARR